MNPDPDNVAGLDASGVKRLERLVDDDRIAVLARRCAREHEQPAWRDDRDPEGEIARIDYENSHEMDTGLVKSFSGRTLTVPQNPAHTALDSERANTRSE